MPEITYTYDEITLQIVQHMEGAPPLAFKERFAPETGRLFAAAPELLAALRGLVSTTDAMADATNCNSADMAIAEARAVLARIEGRT